MSPQYSDSRGTTCFVFPQHLPRLQPFSVTTFYHSIRDRTFETSIMYKYNLNHIVFGIINAIVNKLLESKWHPSSSRDSDSQSQVRHGLRQLFFIYGVAARHSGSGRQPNFAALNRKRHLYSAGRPPRWALAHILVIGWFEQRQTLIQFISETLCISSCNDLIA